MEVFGYVQLVATDYESIGQQTYLELARATAAVLRRKSGVSHWEVSFVLKPVQFLLDPPAGDLCPSLMIWFFAAGATVGEALQIREGLIGSLAAALSRDNALAILGALIGEYSVGQPRKRRSA
jgi:hypothetical protein